MEFIIKTTCTKELMQKGLEVFLFQQKNSRRLLMLESAVLLMVGIVLIVIMDFRISFLLVSLVGVGGMILAKVSGSVMPEIRDEQTDYTYHFSDEVLTVDGPYGKRKCPYGKLIRLYETDDAIVLFVMDNSFFPMWKSDLEEGEWEQLKEFLERRTNRVFKHAAV